MRDANARAVAEIFMVMVWFRFFESSAVEVHRRQFFMCFVFLCCDESVEADAPGNPRARLSFLAILKYLKM